jgi:hypothetical protein
MIAINSYHLQPPDGSERPGWKPTNPNWNPTISGILKHGKCQLLTHNHYTKDFQDNFDFILDWKDPKLNFQNLKSQNMYDILALFERFK